VGGEGREQRQRELCETESAVLVAQNAGHFKNAGACTSYAAKGGQLAKLEVHIHFESNCTGLGSVVAECILGGASGFGLKPSTFVTVKAPAQGFEDMFEVDESGAVSTKEFGFRCPVSGVSATAEGTLASGVPIKAVTTETLSCS
jgi:hypothetical protein